MEKVDVDWSRELSIVRIHHVEWVIGVIKQKYTINMNRFHETLGVLHIVELAPWL